MKKIIYFLVVLGVLSFDTYAQEKNLSVGAGLTLAFPTGSFSDLYSAGFSVSAIVENEVRNDLKITGTLGYLHFGGKLNQFADYSLNAVTFLAGVKYYFLPGYNFYGLSQLGIHFFSGNDITIQNQSVKINIEQSASKFSFALGGGYELPIISNGALDFSMIFMIISDANYFGLRAGYKYSF